MSRGARAARGAAVAVFATFVASLAHTIGGGALPGPVAVLLALAFSTPLAVVLTGARMQLLRTSIAALIAQAALHLLYAMGVGGSWTAVPTDAGMVGHAAHAASALDLSAGAPMVDHGHAAIMPLAHVVAAALTVAFLVAADRAIAAVAVAFGTAVRGIRLLIALLAGLPVPTPPGKVAATSVPDVSRNREALLLSSLRHRGPPAWVLAA